MIFTFTYDITVGPVGYCLVAEIPSTRLRIKTTALARNAYNIIFIAVNFLNPQIINPTAWNLKGKGGFIWAALCSMCLVWSFFRLPEPRNRTPAEIDVLFDQSVSAREFGSVSVEPFKSARLCTTGGLSSSGESSN